MARARNIKPAIMDNEELAELEPLTRLLFIYLWMLADREGKLEDRPKRIAAQALPYDRSADVETMLEQLHKAGFIERYEACGVACIKVVNFTKHQSPHVREQGSELPDNGRSTTKEVTRHNLGSDETSPRSPDSLIPDSLIPDSGYVDTVRPAHTADAAPKRRKAAKTAMPEDFSVSARVSAWAEKNGFDRLDEHLDAFRRKASAKAYTYANWDDAFMEAIREDWAKLRGNGRNGSAPPPSQPADWWTAAGFQNRWEAENELCFAHNAHEFRDGHRVEAVQ